MNTPLPVAATAVTLVLAGCSLVPSLPESQAVTTDRPANERHIEVEVENLETGLPCSVIDRQDHETSDVLWRAQFERGFCRRKAEETRQILQERGWACRPQSAEERQDLLYPSAAWRSQAPHVVAAWRCVGGLEPIEPRHVGRPPVPTAKPDLPERQYESWGNDTLRKAVERDLSTIGQDVIGENSTVDAALGDLNDDGVDDAIVVLTRKADRGVSHRMLMAYLLNGEAYNLVDVWILNAPKDGVDGALNLEIEDGAVLLENCCEDQADPTVLVLDNRKLAHAQGG